LAGQRERARQRLDLADHIADRTEAKLATVIGRHRAKLARVRAAARGLHQLERNVAARTEDVAARARQTIQAWPSSMAIEWRQAACAEIADDLLPQTLALTDHDRVGMLLGLLGQRGGMNAAHHHRDAAPAVSVGDFIATARGLGSDGDADQ